MERYRARYSDTCRRAQLVRCLLTTASAPGGDSLEGPGEGAKAVGEDGCWSGPVPAIDQCLPAMSFAWTVGMYL